MGKKIDLRDVTFLIPVRLDNIQRLENLMLTIEYLFTHFETNLHILEADGYCNRILAQLLPRNIKSRFVEDYDPIFHRTYYINQMLDEVDTPLVAVWDADVIAPFPQIQEAVEWLRSGKADFVRPYDNLFLDTTLIIRELFFKTGNINILDSNQGKMKPMYPPHPVGGGFFANLDKYRESGKENERFYGWGIEDGERVNRWMILGYKYKNTSGVMYHLSHPRGKNSQFHTPQEVDTKNGELFKITSMSKKELAREIQDWEKKGQ